MRSRRRDHALVGLLVAALIAAIVIPLLSVGRAHRRSLWDSKPRQQRVVAAVIAIEGNNSDDEGSPPPAVSYVVLSDLGLTDDLSSKMQHSFHNGVMGRRNHVETVVRRE